MLSQTPIRAPAHIVLSFLRTVSMAVLIHTVIISTLRCSAQECTLYPIALSSQSLSNVSAGATIADVLNGTRPGNFGWLTWAGSPSEPTLVKSLTAPGDSANYVNPDNAGDHQITVGDWMQGKPGVSNSKPVRDALNALTAVDVVVPVWDQSRGQGERTAYRVAAFARVRLLSYQLPGQNRISVRFLGYATCDAVNQPPVVDAGADQTVILPNTAGLNGSLTDDGLPAGRALTSWWSVISGAGAVSFGNSNALVTTAAFSVAGTYLLRLSATDSQLTNSDELVITVNRENHPPVASNLFMTNLEDVAMDITLHGSDTDGDGMSFSVVDDPSHGTLTGTPPDVRYTPFADFNGMDSFTFKVNDGLLDSAVATVIITNSPINDPPVADSQSLTNLEDTSLTIQLSGADVEGSALRFILLSAPTNGVLNVPIGFLSTNTIIYTPNTDYHGPDAFTFKVNDGELDSTPATVALIVQSVNDPPIVDAGSDQLITLPANSVNLAGFVLDDYFEGSGLVTHWSKVSGPGTVTFSNAFATATAAAFSSSGEYVLRLTADDGFLNDSDEVTITVNAPPMVSPGIDQIITFPSGVTLNGAASDDGLPTNGTFTAIWSKVSGPGAVIFADPAVTNTTVTFGEGGVYVLQLSASDGASSVSSNVTVTVNRAPIVDAGSDQLVNGLSVTLTGTVADDGMPTHGAFAVTWSKVSGPGDVTFANPNATNTVASFSVPGIYVLRLTADDSLAATSDEVTVAINSAPVVNAGPDREVLLTDTFTLQGSVTDDGLPPSVPLDIKWTVVSGSSAVIIPDLTSPTSTANFTTPGVYILRLTASDTVATNSDEVTITVRKPNEAPVVYAGQNQLVVLPSTATLNGVVSDDGLPLGASLALSWSKVSGPGNVTFAYPAQATTTASFDAAGNYILQLTASDSELISTGRVTIAVRTPAMNEAPIVNAGPDKVIGLTNVATFAGVVTDDGLPQGAALTVTWSKVSGPGIVSFENPGVAVTRATFSALGTYVLRLTANDTAFTANDEVSVTVYPYNQPPVVDAGADQTLIVPDPTVLNASGQPTNGYTELNLSLFATPHWNNAIGTPGLKGSSSLGGETLPRSMAISGTNLYVAGVFSHANDVEVRGLGRWNGSQWFPLFDSRPINPTNPASPPIGFAGDSFRSVAAWRDQVFVTGVIKNLQLNGQGGFFARWNGSNWFEWPLRLTNFSTSVVGVLAASSNAVYLGGDWGFTTNDVVTGLPTASYGIARWNGTNFQTMGRGVENGQVNSIAIAPNGDVYVAGNFAFTTPTGVASNIARWNGTNWLALGSGINGCTGFSCSTVVLALGIGDSGELYAGGNFTSAGNAPISFFAKWDGTNWSSVGGGISGAVRAITVDGHHLYVAGSYAVAGDFPAFNLARWNGQFWSSFGFGATNGVNTSAFCLGVNSQGIYVGGQFIQAGGETVGHIAEYEFSLPVTKGAALVGSASDDGLPTDSALAFTWTKVSGPGAVNFADPHSPLTTATFSQLGTYVLRLTASDSDLSSFDDVSIEVRGNQPPVVDAGSDQIVTLSEPATFNASVTDDGVTQGGVVVSAWSVLAKPNGSTVTFQSLNSLNTAATFSQPGTYVLRLTANDGQFSSFDDVTVTVIGNNGPPSVSISSATSVALPNSLALTGNVDDDGRPVGITNVYWSQVSGPAPVLFSNANARVTGARFTKAGTYVLRLAATDTELSSSAQRTITVTGADQPPFTSNQPPIANAGPDRSVPILQAVNLAGFVSDDGLPAGSALRSVWSVVSSPSFAYFSNATNPVTSASLIATGTYVLRLAVNDGEFTAFDDVTLTVFRPTNQPPFVFAGPDLEVTRPQPAQLLGTMTDDGLPLGMPVSVAWSKVSGPGTVTFSPNGTNLLPQASFNAPGVYVLQLTATDSQFTTSDTVTIIVNEGTNAPPFVDAGSNLIAALPDPVILHTSASDDGLPEGALEVFWSQVSGPGAAYFSTVNGAYQANFSAAGTYVLRLTADDGALSTSDDVTVTAYNAPTSPLVAILSPLDSATVTAPTIVTGTVSSVILQNWLLEYRLTDSSSSSSSSSDSNTWITLATGTTAIANAPLATFDPTLLLNGLYELRLTATDQVGRTSTTDPVSLVVDRNMKVGHFTVSFKDLTIPVAGIPIEVIRTYDSRDKRPGDFGIGWTLDLKNIRLQKNRTLGNNWEETSTGGGFANYRLDSRRPRLVTITFPDGKAQKFQAAASPDVQFGFPITGPRVVYVPLANTRGSLVSLADDLDDVLVAGSVPGLVDLLEFNGEFYNPSLFQYTSAEGDVYDIDERDGLKRLTDRNGNTLLITTNGITWTNANTGSGLAVTFQRDALSRITNIVDAAGHALTYRYDTNNHLVSFVDRVGQTNGFTYTARHELLSLTDARGIQAVRNEYDESGRLIAQVDASGRTNYFTHDLNARREILTDRLGNVTAHWYDENGNVVQTQDALGNLTRMAYDANDNLVEKVDALGNTNRFTYDARDNKLTETDPLGNTTRYTYSIFRQPTSIRNARGFTTTNIYDASGNLKTKIDALNQRVDYVHDSQGNVVGAANPLGNTIENRYDQLGHLTNTVVRDASAGLLTQTAFEHDSNGNVTKRIAGRTTPNGVESIVTSFAYDSANRLVGMIHPDGSTNATIYNAINKPAVGIDGLGRRTFMDYDEGGNLTRTTYPDNTFDMTFYDAESRRIGRQDQAGRITGYTNDALGRVVIVVYPDNTGMTNFYDAIGRVIATSDARANTTFYGYDAAGRHTSVTNALGQVSRGVFDEVGNLIQAIDALGRTNAFFYDALNRHTNTVLADGTTHSATYNALGQRIAETDQSFNTTRFGFDALGRLTAVTNALGNVTRYEYDEQGLLISQTDALNHVTRFEYDKLGRRTRRTLPLNQVELYGYDAAGNPTNKIDFNGRTTGYAYDALNRLLSKTPDPAFGAPAITFAYDAVGLRTNMTDASGVTAFRYDSRNRLIEKVSPQGTLLYAYDARGNVTNISSTTPHGVRLGYRYDELNRLSDALDSHTGTTTYSYDAVGNLLGYTLPNGVLNFHEYDSLNRLTNLTASRSLSVLAQYTYALNTSGHRISATETLIRDQLNPVPYTISRLYRYDATYRLTNETISASQLSTPATLDYAYDAVGNRLNRFSTLGTTPTTSYGYDSNDRLNSDTYDSNGNTLFASSFAMAQPDRYDFENRLIQRTEPGKTITLVYDGDGNRARKTVATATNTVTTYYLVDTVNPTGYAQVVEEHVSQNSSTPSLQRIYAYGHTLLSQDQFTGSAWVVSFYGLDGHGNTRLLANGIGQITDTYDYDAFGNLIAATGSTPNNFLFTAEQFDPDLRLYFVRARYHDPATGRFWTMDAFEGFSTDPSSLHKYSYCGDDPVNCLDPSGNLTLTEVQISQAVKSILAGMAIGGIGKFLYAYQEGKRGWELAEETSYGVLIGGLAGAGAAGVFAITPAWVLAHGYTQAVLTGLALGTGATESAFAWIEYSYGNYYAGSAHAMNTGLSFFSLGMWRILAPRFEAAEGRAQSVYDVAAGRYRDVATGRFVAARNLPWPSNRGFSSSSPGTLQPGTVIDRFGNPSGRYAGQPGGTVSQRGMAPGADAMPYAQYEVIKPLPAEIGPAAPVPEFGAEGGATQYLFNSSIEELVKQGFLRPR